MLKFIDASTMTNSTNAVTCLLSYEDALDATTHGVFCKVFHVF